MRSLFHRVKAVGDYLAERREADRFQPEGWETAEGRALLSQYRADGVGQGTKPGLDGWDAADESTGQISALAPPAAPAPPALAPPAAPVAPAPPAATPVPLAATPAQPMPAAATLGPPMPAAATLGPPMPAAAMPGRPMPAAAVNGSARLPGAMPAVDAPGLAAPGAATGSAGRGVARVPRQRSADVTRPAGGSRGVARVTPPASADGTPPAAGDVGRHRSNEFNEVARPASEEPATKAVARHRSDEVAVDMNYRPRHDGTQAQVESGYLLTCEPTTRHGGPVGPDGARVLTITNVVRGPEGSPLAGAIVTISLFADCATPGFRPESTIDGVARIITPEEGELIAEWTPEAEVVAMDTHYQVAESTKDGPRQ
jgi:hypothetical protein